MSNAQYQPPRGNEHHGRVYQSERVHMLGSNPPGYALKLYLVLATHSKADRGISEIFAFDKTLMAEAFIGRTTYYKAMKWLKAQHVIHTVTRNRKRVILWGPPQPTLVQPTVPKEQPKAAQPKPAPNGGALKKIEPEAPKMLQPETISKIPTHKGDSDSPPDGVDAVEYVQRKRELGTFGWFNDKQITDLIHYCPAVPASWVRAYGQTRQFRAEINDHRAVLQWHFAEAKGRRQGVILNAEHVSRAVTSLHLDRRYVQAELDGIKLVPTTCEDQMKRAEIEAKAHKSGKSQKLIDALAKTKKGLSESKAIPLID